MRDIQTVECRWRDSPLPVLVVSKVIRGEQGEQGPPGAMGESGLGTGDVTIGQLRDEIAARSEADTALGIRIDDIPDPNYLGTYDNLTQEVKSNVELGNTTLRYGRYWIVHERDNARAQGPLSAVEDGWRAIDGQYRLDAPSQSRIYDGGDHTYVGDNLYFCRTGGSYTSVQIVVSPNWDNLTGGGEAGGGDVTTAQLNAEIAARTEGDTALGIRIDELPDPGPGDGVTEAQLQAEVTAREEGDTALGTRIDDLPDTVSPGQLFQETLERSRQDSILRDRLNNLPDTDAQFQEEALQRSSADIALGNLIDDIPPPGINIGQATAVARAVTADWAEANNSDQIPANKLGNAAQATARNEVLVPFRPGANPALILIQSIGYVTAADGYTEYNAPFYISDGRFTRSMHLRHVTSRENRILLACWQVGVELRQQELLSVATVPLLALTFSISSYGNLRNVDCLVFGDIMR